MLLFFSSSKAERRREAAICRCWETNVGQEMFKLMLIQTLAEVGSILIVEGAHWLFAKATNRFCKRMGILVEKLVSQCIVTLASQTLYSGMPITKS